MEQLPQLTEDEFEHIEEEIARTTKGRSFLRRFRRRAMGAATEEIRTMLEEFRLSWRQQTQVLEAAGRVNVLRQELIEMAASIERARREIAALQPADADNNRIITATNELDAIVISTERASFEILNAAEHLMELSGQFREGGAAGDLCNSLEADVTAIFTACSFQDLTGQRTSKVVNALRYIEQRIIAVISIWGATDDSSAPIADEWADKREDAHLLSGPQREGKGVSQHDVDRMFESDEFVPAPAKSAPTSLPSRGSAFAGKEANQSDIDSLFDSPAPAPAGKSGGMPKAQQSQSDIDALFDVEPPAPTLHDQPDQRISHFDKHQSQSDIDSLFNSTAPPTPKPPPKLQNQADMDALFDSSVPTPSKSATTLQSQSDIDALFDAPPAKTTPPPRAAKAAPPPPPEAKPKPKAKPPEPGAALDQSAIDALFG